jgi:hypothetical protein
VVQQNAPWLGIDSPFSLSLSPLPRFTFPDCEADAYNRVWDLYGFYEGPDNRMSSLKDKYTTMYPDLVQKMELDGEKVELKCLDLVRPPSQCPFFLEILHMCSSFFHVRPSSVCGKMPCALPLTMYISNSRRRLRSKLYHVLFSSFRRGTL